ncbi:MAG: hypothetical protein Aurels2KO_54040 [Aureliella sp.]
MKPLSEFVLKPNGGRVATAQYRKAIKESEVFEGLEEGADRYSLLLLVKRAGKSAGFSPRMIQLLDYYMAYTRDVDWTAGAAPIVYQSVSRTALDLGVSERQIQKLEKALFEAGAIAWRDSGNHRRYGQRDKKTGQITYAFGVDLSPLASLRTQLEKKLEEKTLYENAWMETKRQISYYRSQIRGCIAESREEGASTNEATEYDVRYQEIAVQLRTNLTLEKMKQILGLHKELHQAVLSHMGVGEPDVHQGRSLQSSEAKTPECSPKRDRKFAHIKPTTQESLNKLSTQQLKKPVATKPLPTAADIEGRANKPIRLSAAVTAASDRYKAYLPLTEPNWSDFVEAAARLRSDLGISYPAWATACSTLGRNGASLCLMVTDRASLREQNQVRSPAAYFRGMLNKAEQGKLNLERSVTGLCQVRRRAVGENAC